jgi:hypothetical protein
MTPQERQLVDELFDRLAPLERAQRDPDAERAIDDGLSRAPNAIYALVQTVLVQDEALKRADARIRELSGEEEAPRSGGSFLDTMRSAITGRSGSGSVPSVRPGATDAPDPRWNTGGANANQGAPYGGQPGAAPYGAPPGAAPYGAAPSAGGSFLGTAAASAAGAIGGAMLFNSIGSLFGRHESGSAFGGISNAAGSPSDNSASRSDLARDAGLNDVGDKGRDQRQAGFMDNSDNDDDKDDPDYDNDPGADVDAGDFDSDDFDGGDDTDTA